MIEENVIQQVLDFIGAPFIAIKSWSLMETVLSVSGLLMVLLLNMVI